VEVYRFEVEGYVGGGVEGMTAGAAASFGGEDGVEESQGCGRCPVLVCVLGPQRDSRGGSGLGLCVHY
jgi:hypothetical protein